MKAKYIFAIIVGILLVALFGLVWQGLNTPITDEKIDEVGIFKLNLGQRYREDDKHFITFSGRYDDEYFIITEMTWRSGGYKGGPTCLEYKVHVGSVLYLWDCQFLVTELTDQYVVLEVSE